MTVEWPPLLPLLLLPCCLFWNLVFANNNIGRNVWTNESPNTIGLSLVSNYFFPGPPRAWYNFHFYIDFKLKFTCWKPVLCWAAWKECIEFFVADIKQRWANSVLRTEYEYEYYSSSKKWPNTNTNIIRLSKTDRIRILFGLPKMTEYEYKYYWTL